MPQIILDIIISVLAVFGFFYLCLNYYGFLLKSKNNYNFKAELYIQLDDSLPIEHILNTFEFFKEKYFPNMKIIVHGQIATSDNVEAINAKVNDGIVFIKQ